jgi:sugar lactone lactonase YvrE
MGFDRRRLGRRLAYPAFGLAATLVACMAFATPRAGAFTYITTWGSTGAGDGELSVPAGVAVDRNGSVYVADSGNHRVQKFSPHGAFITKWGTQGGGDREFSDPRDVTTDAIGNVYVADTGNHRIQKFTSSGGDLRKWGGPNPGSGEGDFNLPAGIATDAAGNVYVADTGNHRIQKFTATGGFLGQWGTLGPGNDQFNGPADVATDAAGNVYVADRHNDRVQKFDSSGGFLATFGAGQVVAPYGVEVDSAGSVYVAEVLRFQRFAADGAFSAAFETWAAGQPFNVLGGLGGDCRDNLYVTDAGDQLHKFGEPATLDPPCRPAPPPPPPPAPVSDSAAPAITSASMSRRTFRVDRRGPVAARKRTPRGTTFRVALSEAATVGFAIKRRIRGQRVKGRCRPARKNRKGKRCELLPPLGSFNRARPAGTSRVRFSGRLLVRGKTRVLKRGRYRVTLRATDAAGNRSKPRRLHFRVARR